MNIVGFTKIMLLHGKGGSPEGSVKQLEDLLVRYCPGREERFERPRLLHSDSNVSAEESHAAFAELNVPEETALIGISLGGLIAAKYQEEHNRDDIHVISISSPTWADGVHLTKRMANRVALYSSADDVIRGRTAEWPKLACAFDLPWLTHNTDQHKQALAKILLAYLDGDSLPRAIIEVESQRATKKRGQDGE
jgi:pimeloyl-ACP methyl ester carboxylesterase